jgi:hypothetical protein
MLKKTDHQTNLPAKYTRADELGIQSMSLYLSTWWILSTSQSAIENTILCTKHSVAMDIIPALKCKRTFQITFRHAADSKCQLLNFPPKRMHGVKRADIEYGSSCYYRLLTDRPSQTFEESFVRGVYVIIPQICDTDPSIYPQQSILAAVRLLNSCSLSSTLEVCQRSQYSHRLLLQMGRYWATFWKVNWTEKFIFWTGGTGVEKLSEYSQ